MSLSIYIVENFDKVNIISRSVSIKMWTASFRQDKKKAVVLRSGEEREKNLLLPYLTLRQMTGSGSDPPALIG